MGDAEVLLRFWPPFVLPVPGRGLRRPSVEIVAGSNYLSGGVVCGVVVSFSWGGTSALVVCVSHRLSGNGWKVPGCSQTLFAVWSGFLSGSALPNDRPYRIFTAVLRPTMANVIL